MTGSPSCRRARNGFLLVEGLIGIALFAVFVSGVIIAFVVSEEHALSSGDAARGAFLAEQGLEVAASLRDRGFDQLTPGTHGYAATPEGWVLSGTGVTSSGGFTTSLEIAELEDDLVRVTVVTSWTHRRGGPASVTLTEDLADWRSVLGGAGNCSTLTVEGDYVDAGTPLFNRAVVSGDTLYVTSETSAGGKSLYVFDLSVGGDPVRVNASFSLTDATHDLAVQGNVLYLLTDDPVGEVKAYDVTDPATFGAGQLLAVYDLPGSARGRSLSLQHMGSQLRPFVVVGATDDAAESQVVVLEADVTSSGGRVTALALAQTGSLLDTGGGVFALSAVSPSLLYAATGNNVAELRAYALEADGDGVAVTIASGSGYNATDIQDGLSVAVSGTAALLGRADGEAIEELVLFPLSLVSAPSTPPGPWFHDAGGAVNGLAMDVDGQCAFVATGNPTKELFMMRPPLLADAQAPETATYDSTTGDGRGVAYDPGTNTLVLLTNQAVLLFRPS